MPNLAQVKSIHTITRIQKKALSNLHKKLVRLGRFDHTDTAENSYQKLSRKQFIKHSRQLNN